MLRNHCSWSGGINERELLRTFNCGVGMVLIVSEEHKRAVVNEVPNSSVIGEVQARKEGKLTFFKYLSVYIT